MLGPILALVALVVVAILTVTLLIGRFPLTVGGGDGNGGGGVPIDATPAPSNVVVVPKDPRADVPGSIVYVKQGSIWIQSGTTVRQLTSGDDDASPAWTSDGKWVYFVRTVQERGLRSIGRSRPAYYTMTYPVLMRVDPSGGDPEQVLSGKVKSGKLTSFYWLREPMPNPVDPNQLAVVTSQPASSTNDVVLQLLDATTHKFTIPKGTKEVGNLGHQDPAWHPNGTVLLYVMNDRDGRRGAPSIWRYDPARDRVAKVTGPGYLAPSYSPDGKYIAATKTTTTGTDVVVLDATSGGEVLQVTTDGQSWSPAWSPRGDAIAYLHVRGQIVDLRMATLSGTAPPFSVADTIDLTVVSGLDGASRPSWYIPVDELPASPAPSSPGASTGPPSPSP